MRPIDEPAPTLGDTEAFVDERGFFRTRPRGTTRRDPLAGFEVEPGPPWTPEEAQVQMRRFLDLLADGRPLHEDHPDPLEHAQRNGLLLLIGPEEERHVARLARRMPRAMALTWREALRGGQASDAFGPLSEPERLDEARVEAELRSGRRTRRRSLLLFGGLVILIGAGAIVYLLLRDGSAGKARGEITFEATEEEASGNLRAGPPPAVDPALLVRLEQPVALREGSGDEASRIVLDPPVEHLPQAPGAISVTLFRYNGSGQVVLVGPPGWPSAACVELAPISQGLRPFETAYFEGAPGLCPDVPMREATVGCLSDTTLMVDLRLPRGEVSLEEGGSTAVAGVRVKLVGSTPGYETVSLNAQISVASGDEIVVPSFGGELGETVSFDMSAATGAPIVGSCVIQ